MSLDMAPLRTAILYQKGNGHGLSDDVRVVQRLLTTLADRTRTRILAPVLADLREPLSHSDLQFHLEIPVYGAIPWGHVNVLLVNPEQWSYAYDAYVQAFDAILFRDPQTAERFRQDFLLKGLPTEHLYTLPWCDSWTPETSKKGTARFPGFVCFLAGSSHKYEYVKSLLPYWTDADPPLRIYTTRDDIAKGLRALHGLASSVSVIHQDLTETERRAYSYEALGHLIVSQAEGYGYAASHSETVGAFAIMNRLPVFINHYGDSEGVAWLSNETTASTTVRCDLARPGEAIRQELEAAFAAFQAYSASSNACVARRSHAANRFETLCGVSLPLFERLFLLVQHRRPAKGVYHCPPLLHVADCPPISIVTPTYHREKLIDIAFHNMLATDYPRNKIEWVIVEDGTQRSKSAREKIISFQLQVPDLKIKYIPIEGQMTIGEKRNLGVEHSTHEIILFMDDDDHYPSTSFRRRVAWLLRGDKKRIACCTTIALYDLIHGVSAVNVPPYHLPLSQRISEATLTFQKSVWKERPFPAISVAEGEGWIEGREHEVLEMPAQQIIVAFTHGQNQSSRRIPPSGPPSCFWGFPKEYLVFVHGLAGITVEEDHGKRKK